MRTIACILILVSNWTLLNAKNNPADSLKKVQSLIPKLKQQFTLSQYDHAEIIMPFNGDTFLIAGYLSDFNMGNSPKNVVYRTMDAGAKWEMLKFNGDAWIYTSHFQKDGKIWMGGSDEYVHYSNNYGTTWTKMPKPFTPFDRVLLIYMIDSMNGIAGGLQNGLALTNDNWQTTKQIPSPLDQNKYTITENSARNRIDKIAVLDSVIIINQNDHIYYSKLNPINWKEFNIPVSDFSLDKLNKQWSIFSLGNKVYVLSSKLDLVKTYSLEDDYLMGLDSHNKPFSLEKFFSSDLVSVEVKAVKYDFDNTLGYHNQFPILKEDVMEVKINDSASLSSLKEILSASGKYTLPSSQMFAFTEQDFASYDSFYSQLKKKRNEEKVWGGDFTSLLNIDSGYFTSPKGILKSLNQSLIDSVYKNISFSSLFTRGSRYRPYISLNLINSKSDTLKITSINSGLFSLPWAMFYNGKLYKTYDTRITEYLRAILPKDFNCYDSLFAGELIYRLIEQRTINELHYQKGN